MKIFYSIIFSLASLACSSQIIMDAIISDEVGIIIKNYHKNGVDKFSIEYKNDWINELDSFSNILTYEFIDDSTFIHKWNGLEANYTIRKNEFIYNPSEEEELAYRKANSNYYSEKYKVGKELHWKSYFIGDSIGKNDTILTAHSTFWDTVSTGLYTNILSYDYLSGELIQKDERYRLTGDTIRRIYQLKESGIFILLEDSKWVRKEVKTKNSEGYCEYTKTRQRVYNTSPIQYSTSDGNYCSITYFNKDGLVQEIIMTNGKGKRNRENLIPKILK